MSSAKPPDIVLTGPTGAGKSKLASLLAEVGWHAVTARNVLRAAEPEAAITREALQELGARLEDERPGNWLIEAAAASRPAVVDAARTQAQVAAARGILLGCIVVHLDAPVSVRRRRFNERRDPADDGVEFDELCATPLEREAEDLGRLADVVLDARATPESLLDLVLQTAEQRRRDDRR